VIETIFVWIIMGGVFILLSTKKVENSIIYSICFFVYTFIKLLIAIVINNVSHLEYYFRAYLKQAIFTDVILAYYTSLIIFSNIQLLSNPFIFVPAIFSIIQIGLVYKNVKTPLIKYININKKEYHKQIKLNGYLEPKGYALETNSYDFWMINNGIFTIIMALIYFNQINATPNTVAFFLFYCIYFFIQQAAIITSFEYFMLYHYSNNHIESVTLNLDVYTKNVRRWP